MAELRKVKQRLKSICPNFKAEQKQKEELKEVLGITENNLEAMKQAKVVLENAEVSNESKKEDLKELKANVKTKLEEQISSKMDEIVASKSDFKAQKVDISNMEEAHSKFQSEIRNDRKELQSLKLNS